MRFPRALPVFLSILSTISLSWTAGAQVCDPFLGCTPPQPAPRPERRETGWEEHAATAGLNALLGGLSAGTMRAARGGSFKDGFLAGAAGGALIYGGKRIAVERWGGAGVLGRQVAAVGSSVVWNASAGRGPLDRVMLPLGPVRVYVLPDAGWKVSPKLDLASAVATVMFATEAGAEFDLGESVSAGAPVFRRKVPYWELGWDGRQAAGAVSVWTRDDDDLVPAEVEVMRSVLAHERVHVIQYDQTFLFWSEPAEAWAMDPSRVGRAIRRHVDLGLNVALMGALNEAVSYEDRPWEREAYFLSGTREVDRAGPVPQGSR